MGYEAIEQALHNQAPLFLMAILILVKIFATSLTIGSGGSGEVFAPALFLGAMLGGSFGTVVHTLFPGVTAVPGAYALVGMAAVFAAAAQAPISAILILFEMTGDYRIILPLMLATVISTFLAERVYGESIYTVKLSRRGIRLERGRDVDVLQTVRVDEVMTTRVDTVPTTMTLPALARAFERTHHHSFPVREENGRLYGIVSIQDLERAMSSGDVDGLRVADIATTNLVTVYPGEPMSAAIERMTPRDLNRLPVVDRSEPHRLMGIIRRGDLGRAYNVGIMRRAERQHRVDQLRMGPVADSKMLEFEISDASPLVGKAVREVELPEDCLLVAIRREGKLIVPHGPTALAAGDRVTVFGTRPGLTELRSLYQRMFSTRAC